MSGELLYQDPRRVVRLLRDGFSHELAGLNEDEAVKALVYAQERLLHWLAVIGQVLAMEQVAEEEVEDEDDGGQQQAIDEAEVMR